MSSLDLITLANVREWLNTTGKATSAMSTVDDALLARLVTAVSAFASQFLQRNLQPTSYVETYNGTDTRMLPVRNPPIISVSLLTIGTTAIAARTAPGQAGYAFDAQMLYLDGCRTFCRGVQNIAVSYRAGLQLSDTTAVPSPIAPLSVTTLSRPWNSDQGVVHASGGAAFTKVTTAPSVAGTYQLTQDSAKNWQYVFAAADAGMGIVISYGYTPEDVVQGLVELAGERFKVRGRIGESSQVQGAGLSVSFSQRDMNATIRQLLFPYRNVVPVQ